MFSTVFCCKNDHTVWALNKKIDVGYQLSWMLPLWEVHNLLLLVSADLLLHLEPPLVPETAVSVWMICVCKIDITIISPKHSSTDIPTKTYSK